MNITEAQFTQGAIIAFFIACLALLVATTVGLWRLREWLGECKSKAAHAEFNAAAAEAQAVADDLKRRVLEAEAVAITGPIAVVKVSRKGRSRLDKTVVAAGEITRLADAELDRAEGKP